MSEFVPKSAAEGEVEANGWRRTYIMRFDSLAWLREGDAVAFLQSFCGVDKVELVMSEGLVDTQASAANRTTEKRTHVEAHDELRKLE